MTTIHTPATLPSDDNVNPYAYSVEVRGEMIIRKGKMIAYYGRLQFESLATGSLSGMLLDALNAPNTLHDFVRATGHGKLILGDNGNDIASYNVEDATFTIRAENILAFAPTLRCQQSTVDGFMTLLGTGKLLASSNGPAVFLEPPCRCDPDSVLGWADMPSPSYRYDHAYVNGIVNSIGAMTGMTASGEEQQLDFFGKGVVLLQSGEQGLRGRSDLAAILARLPGMDRGDVESLFVNLQSMLGRR
jgi:uncharacterized protein (AIM24 family)